MRILLATNEPWGTYHATPLVAAARRRGIELVQWCPTIDDRVPRATTVQVTGTPEAIALADLVIVNGLASSHTHAAVAGAVQAGVPICLTELAYLFSNPPASVPNWSRVLAASPASAPVLGVCAGVRPGDVTVCGHPLLDELPARAPETDRIVALTTVSESSETGGGAPDANALLFDSLLELERLGLEITVRTHPREPEDRWAVHWPVNEDASTAIAISRASCVVGVAGTAVLYTTALGVPFVAVVPEWLPDYLRSAVVALDAPHSIGTPVDQASAISPSHRDWICGPIGGAVECVLDAWLSCGS